MTKNSNVWVDGGYFFFIKTITICDPRFHWFLVIGEREYYTITEASQLMVVARRERDEGRGEENIWGQDTNPKDSFGDLPPMKPHLFWFPGYHNTSYFFSWALTSNLMGKIFISNQNFADIWYVHTMNLSIPMEQSFRLAGAHRLSNILVKHSILAFSSLGTITGLADVKCVPRSNLLFYLIPPVILYF